MRCNPSSFWNNTSSEGLSKESPSSLSSPWGNIAHLHLLLWLGFALLYFILDQGRHPDRESIPLAIRSLWWATVGAGTSSILVMLYRLIRPEHYRLWARIWITLTASVSASVLWLVSFVFWDGLIDIEPGFVALSDWSTSQVFSEATDYTLIMLTWHGFMLAAIQTRQSHRLRERALRAEMLAERAKSAELRHQLNPHFLFNSLNSAASLTAEDPSAAEQMILALSDLLRETLNRGVHETISVRDELELAHQYIQIEKVRYEDLLEYEEDTDPSCQTLSIPHLLIQPLIENAVKHGMQTSSLPLKIRVQTQVHDNHLLVKVQNTGHLQPRAGLDNSSHGIRILTERLSLAYGNKHTFTLRESEQYVTAEVRIPMESST